MTASTRGRDREGEKISFSRSALANVFEKNVKKEK